MSRDRNITRPINRSSVRRGLTSRGRGWKRRVTLRVLRIRFDDGLRLRNAFPSTFFPRISRVASRYRHSTKGGGWNQRGRPHTRARVYTCTLVHTCIHIYTYTTKHIHTHTDELHRCETGGELRASIDNTVVVQGRFSGRFLGLWTNRVAPRGRKSIARGGTEWRQLATPTIDRCDAGGAGQFSQSAINK